MSSFKYSRLITQGRCALDFLLDPAALSSPSSFPLLAVASCSSGEGSRRTRTEAFAVGSPFKRLHILNRVGQALRFAAQPVQKVNLGLPFAPLGEECQELPSGDHRGCSEETPSAVSTMASPPTAGTM